MNQNNKHDVRCTSPKCKRRARSSEPLCRRHDAGPVRKTFRWLFRIIALILVIFTTVYGIAVANRMAKEKESALTAAAEIARDAGFDPLVATLENIWYGVINAPKIGGDPTAIDTTEEVIPDNPAEIIPLAPANNPAWGPAGYPSRLPDRLTSPLDYEPGEGEWKPTKIIVNHTVAAWTTQVRPDKDHSSIWATVLWMDPNLLAFQQIPGTEIPEGNYDHGDGRVPAELRDYYMIGFADGYRMDQSQGGYEKDGKVIKKLVKGKATLLTYPDGRITIAKWGTDTVLPGYTIARQNLDMIVDHGVSQVVNENQGKWGGAWKGTGSGGIYVWRSGLGIRADGTLVYVQSDALSAGSLANLLVRAGAVKAIALDMNSGFATGAFYGPYGSTGKHINPSNPVSTSVFWNSTSREFVAVYAKSPAGTGK